MAIHHERLGEGPATVLIHGLGGAIANWRPVMERLAAERDVIAVDMPGFGRSDPLPAGTRHSAAEMGRALRSHLSGLGVDSPHLVGNSLGAWVALELAADGYARSVCGISPAGLWRGALGVRSRDVHAQAKRLRPFLLRAVRTQRGRGLLMRGTVARPELLSGDEAAEWLAAWIDGPAYADANEMMRAEPFARAGEIEVPVTIAWGTQDRLVGRPRAERIPPHTRFLEMEGWGHTPTRDDPEGVVRLILEATAADERGVADAATG